MTNQQQCKAFFKSQKSLVLSTLDATGQLETSVAPFVLYDEKIYIYVSELAKHTQNLLWLIEGNRYHNQSQGQDTLDSDLPGLVSAILIADEAQTEQLFARERITLQLLANEVDRENSDYSKVLGLFQQQFGEVVDVLSGLSDFHLIQLSIVKGGYVKGFGQAFAFESKPCDNLTPVFR